jgi:hypothetical protein
MPGRRCFVYFQTEWRYWGASDSLHELERDMENRDIYSRAIRSAWKAAPVGALLPTVLLWLLSLSSPRISGFGEIMRIPALELADWWNLDSKELNPYLLNATFGAMLFAAGAIHWHLVLNPIVRKKGVAVTEEIICKCILAMVACLVCGFLSPIALAFATTGAQHLSSALGARFENLQLILGKPAEYLSVNILNLGWEGFYLSFALLLAGFYAFCFFFGN